MITVILLNDIHYKNAPTQAAFQSWVDMTLKHVSEKIPPSVHEVCISIVSADTSASLNETYRHKKGPTNVLSFEYESMPGVLSESLGDLAICADVMEAEARQQPRSLKSHWAHITVHGILHLLGFDHIVDLDAEIMESLETTIVMKLGFEDPYA